ncbi:MAG: hypothetical protein JNM43_06120 [Planctomycetaceae bacterium]|nr:hypothetical protein [Planctomycetaceae bacterium]
MSTSVPETTLVQIRAELEAGRLIDAVKLYRAATGLGLKDCRDNVLSLWEKLATEDPERYFRFHDRPKGRAWTLIVAVAVFAWILWTIYGYIFPRLSGEKVSPTAALEIRYTSTNDPGDDDGQTALVAADFSTFRGWPEAGGRTRMTLNLNETGAERLLDVQKRADTKELLIFVRKQLIGRTRVSQPNNRSITFDLIQDPAIDANEIMARLTE